MIDIPFSTALRNAGISVDEANCTRRHSVKSKSMNINQKTKHTQKGIKRRRLTQIQINKEFTNTQKNGNSNIQNWKTTSLKDYNFSKGKKKTTIFHFLI